MSPKLIVVGATYRNRGMGHTHRTVLAIGTDIVREDEPNRYVGVLVRYRDRDTATERLLPLDSFASWAGSRVDDAPAADLDGQPKGATQ